MRVLYLSENCSDHNRRFLRELAAHGCEVTFIDITGHGFASDRLPPGVEQVPLTSPFDENASTDRVRCVVQELNSIIAQVEPDVVHAGPIPNCGYLAAATEFHPLVLMSWGSDLLLNQADDPKSRARTALGACDGFVCDCDSVRAAARQHFALRVPQVAQFPWGISPESFSPVGPLPSPDAMPFGENTVKLICTRSWEPIYRTVLLLEAFLHAHAKAQQLRLLLLGNGSEREEVLAFISENRLEKIVRTPGCIQHSELPAWFRAADGYVSCAASDGTSVSLLEAMASGLPVLVTDVPSNREWVNEGENGWLACDKDDFAAKLLTMANLSRMERDAISEKNQRIVKLRANWNDNFPKLLQLYERVVSQAQRVSATSGRFD